MHPWKRPVAVQGSKRIAGSSYQCLMRAEESLTRLSAGDHRTGSGTAHSARGGDKNGEGTCDNKCRGNERMASGHWSHRDCLILLFEWNGQAASCPVDNLTIFKLGRESSISMRGIEQIRQVRTLSE